MGKRLSVWGLGRELEAGFGGLGKELGAGSAGWVAAPLLLNSHSCPWWKSLLAPPWAGISLTESARPLEVKNVTPLLLQLLSKHILGQYLMSG